MKLNIERYKDFAKRGMLEQGGFGDLRDSACLVSSLTGGESFDDCVAEGWPRWLAQLAAQIFDTAPKAEMFERGLAVAEAIKCAEGRGADFDQVRRNIRVRAILPIALHAVGEGNEDWRVQCREAVQWSLDNGGEPANSYRAVGAARAAGAAYAAYAAYAAEDKYAAGARYAAGAEYALDAAYIAIFECTVACLLGEDYKLVWPPEEA